MPHAFPSALGAFAPTILSDWSNLPGDVWILSFRDTPGMGNMNPEYYKVPE